MTYRKKQSGYKNKQSTFRTKKSELAIFIKFKDNSSLNIDCKAITIKSTYVQITYYDEYFTSRTQIRFYTSEIKRFVVSRNNKTIISSAV